MGYVIRVRKYTILFSVNLSAHLCSARGCFHSRIMPVKSADEFYSIMGVLTREMLEFGLMDANSLIKVGNPRRQRRRELTFYFYIIVFILGTIVLYPLSKYVLYHYRP